MPSPKISIVIPIYQPTGYLAEALGSIMRQSYQDFEIIVSDDSATPDNASRILGGFAQLPITYIQNKTGQGIFNNLNNAIAHAKGEFIQIFCQDDIMLDFFLEEQLALFDKGPNIGMVFSRYTGIGGKGEFIPFLPHMAEAMATWKEYIPQEKAINNLFVFGCMPGNLSPVMIKRSVIDQVGTFQQELSFGGDFAYWIRIAEHYGFGYSKRLSIYIRVHEKQASETLGLFRLIPDSVVIYKSLYRRNTVKASGFKKYLHVNNLFVGNFIGVIKNLTGGRWKYFSLLWRLNGYPLHLVTIFLLLIHRKVKRRVSWFLTEPAC